MTTLANWSVNYHTRAAGGKSCAGKTCTTRRSMDMSRCFSRAICTLVLFTIIAAGTAAAQDFRGVITGRVVDSSGGRLPGVTVSATNVATNVASTTVTNSEGGHDSVSDRRRLSSRSRVGRIKGQAGGHRGPNRRSAHPRSHDWRWAHVEETVPVTAESPAARARIRIGGPGHRRETHLDDAAFRRQPVPLARLVPGWPSSAT